MKPFANKNKIWDEVFAKGEMFVSEDIETILKVQLCKFKEHW